jgi:hypothetical protein
MQLIIIFPELYTIWSQTIIILTQEGQWPRLVLDKIPVITICSDKNNNTFFYAQNVMKELVTLELVWTEQVNVWLYPTWTESI